MSLSFISKSVQTATDDGGFEEKPVADPKEIRAGGRSGGVGGDGHYRSLFDQLRANQEEADAERAEQQKALMRGTTELNEEDAAHLKALNRQRLQQEAAVQWSTEQALAEFRAAQADKQDATAAVVPRKKTITLTATNSFTQDLEQNSNVGCMVNPTSSRNNNNNNKRSAVTMVIRKKKRRQQPQEQGGKDDDDEVQDAPGMDSGEKGRVSLEPLTPQEEKAKEGGIGGLLTGYGSSSSEDDDDDDDEKSGR